MKGAITWLGTEESFAVLRDYELKFAGDVKAFYDDNQSDPVLDKNFNVLNDRMGLSLLTRYADVAVLKVSGSLTNAYSRWHSWFPGVVTSYEAIRDALAIVGNESGISKVYLDLSTGGGGVRGLDLTTDMINRVKAVKPVFAHTDSMAFSAGYWLAAGCTEVSASRMAELGSIGTLMVLENVSEAAALAGIKYHVFRAGEFKAVGLPYETLTEEHAAYLQANLEKTNKFFLEHVSRNRNLMMSDRGQWGEGKTFFAEEAMQVGLVDRVANLIDLIGSAASQTITSDTRRFEMNISAEKLAQIAAGADPKVVLTAEELIQYTASLEAEEPKAGGEDEGEKEASETPAVAAADPSVAADLHKQIGRLEAKLEAAELKIKAADEAAEVAASATAAVLTVAQCAVANLQTALGTPKEAKSTPTEVVAQFNDLSAVMAARFKVGQVTKTPTEDTTAPSGALPASFRHHQ